MEALRVWSLTTSQPLMHHFHLATTTSSLHQLILRISSTAITTTTEGRNRRSSSSSSSTSDRDVVCTIHLKKKSAIRTSTISGCTSSIQICKGIRRTWRSSFLKHNLML